MKTPVSPTPKRLPLSFFALVLSAILIVQHSSAQAPADVLTLKGNVSLHVVDQTGRPIAATEIPEDLRLRLEGLDFRGGSEPGLLLARAILPQNEQDLDYDAQLVGRGFTMAACQPNLRTGTDRSVISCWIARRDYPCRLNVSKLNYKAITVPLPEIDPAGKIIWLGGLSLAAYSRTDPVWQIVSGMVVTPDGKPVNGGEASLRVNGTPAKTRLPLTNGTFTFRDVTPGDRYLVEFWIEGCSVATWPLSIKDADEARTVTAYPLRKYHIQVDDPDDPRELWVTAGIPYRDSQVTFKDRTTIRFVQTGDVFHLDCSQSIRMRIGDKIFPSGSYRWTGNLKKGDTVELLDKVSEKALHKITCLEVSGPEASTGRGVVVAAGRQAGAAARQDTVPASPANHSKAGAAAGDTIALKFTAVDGREVDFAKLRGKVILIDFWATWCGPCIGELPHVLDAYRKFHDKGFEIVGISFDQDKGALERLTKEKGMTWPQYFDGKGWKNDYGVKYGIHGIPTMWLVDQQGRIATTNARQDLAGQVEKLLAAKTDLPASAGDQLLVSEGRRITRIDPSGASTIFLEGAGKAEVFGDKVYVLEGRTVAVLDSTGAQLRRIDLPEEVRVALNFVILPDGRMAFLDNQNDAVYFTDTQGRFLKKVPLLDHPDSQWQNVHGLVVNDSLIVSENGHKQIVSINLTSYQPSILRDLGNLSGWLGAIAYANGRFYLCQATKIFTFSADSSELKFLAETPEGNITGIVAAGGHVFVVVNGRSKGQRGSQNGILYEINPNTGAAATVASGLDYPEGLAVLRVAKDRGQTIGQADSTAAALSKPASADAQRGSLSAGGQAEKLLAAKADSSAGPTTAPAKPVVKVGGGAAEKSSGAESLPWEKDYASALAKAKTEKRPIFLMLTATWCGPCRALESQTLPDPMIRAAMKDFVWVKAYEDKELNAKHGLSGYPTLVFLDAEQERTLARTVGYQAAGPFLKPIIEARKAANLPLTPEMQKAAAASFEPDHRKLEELSQAGDLAGLISYLQPVAKDELRKNNYLALRVHLPSGLAPSEVVCLASGRDVLLNQAGVSVVSTSRTGSEAEIRIVAPGYRAIQDRVPPSDATAVQSREYQLEPLAAHDAATFSGRVLLPSGEPAAQAIVRICDWGAVTRTDKDGRFRLRGVSPGKFLVRAERPGGEFHSELEFSPGAELQRDLRLEVATTVGLRWVLQTEEGVRTFTGKSVRTGEAYFSVRHSRFLLERGAQTREYWGSDLMLKEWSESLREYAKPEALAAVEKAPSGTPIFWLFDATSRRTGLHRETARFEEIDAVNGGKPFDEKSYFEFLRGQPVTVGAVYTLRCVRRDCYAKLEVTDITLAPPKR